MSGVSSLPAVLDFEAFVGNTFRRSITVTQGGSPYNLATANVIFYLRTTKAGTPVITLTEGNGIVVASNIITITLTPAQLETWINGATLFYELQVNEGSDINTWMVGRINLRTS